jgi:hypothetical protein
VLADRTLVNLARAPAKVHPLFKGGAEVVLHDGTRLDLCRRFCAGACAVPGLHGRSARDSVNRVTSPVA